MYSNKDNIIYLYCNKKEVIAKWVRLIYDELELKSEYLIHAIGYKNEMPLRYCIDVFEDGLQWNSDKYESMYLRDTKLSAEKSLMSQGIVCGDMISKICVSNEIDIFIKTYTNELSDIALKVWTHFSVQRITELIVDKCGMDSFAEYALMYDKSVMSDGSKQLKDYNIQNKDVLQCVRKVNEEMKNGFEMDSVCEGKSAVCVNVSRYNPRSVTRVYVHIVNGYMWKKITGNELPQTEIDRGVYKQNGYEWSDLFEEKEISNSNRNDSKLKKQTKHKKVKPGLPPVSHEINCK